MSSHPFTPQPASSEATPFPWKWVALGCGGAALVALGLLAMTCSFVMHAAEDPEGFRVSVQAPARATIGVNETLVVEIVNERSDEPVSLRDITFRNSYLDAFTVLRVDPEPRKRTRWNVGFLQSFKYDLKIPAGETRTFSFVLSPVEAGTFRGDVDCYEGRRSITKVAETVVSAPPP